MHSVSHVIETSKVHNTVCSIEDKVYFYVITMYRLYNVQYKFADKTLIEYYG